MLVPFFKPFMDLRLGPKGKICGMCHYGGAVVACSTDKSIKVLKLYRTGVSITFERAVHDSPLKAAV